jgi:hypothetical protein
MEHGVYQNNIGNPNPKSRGVQASSAASEQAVAQAAASA